MKQVLTLFTALLFCACQSSTVSNNIQHSLTKFTLLSKNDAQKAVTTDTKEGYFDKVTILEMSIQLEMESPSGERDSIVARYKKLLQDDIEDFTSEEKKNLTEQMNKALDMCAKIDPKLKLPEIQLIKTAGKYYGASVYYTRDNNIIIPALQLKEKEVLLRTLIHEIFHVYSRYNTDKRDALYAAIGYKKLDKLELSEFLKKRVIYNPDGVNMAYAIEVQDSSGRSFHAIPAMYSKFSSYRLVPLLKSFVFQLFEVEQQEGVWKVISKDVGYSEDQVKGYWEKIGRNTRYTIHPDEICADNFTFLAYLRSGNKQQELTPEGQALLEKLEKIIKG